MKRFVTLIFGILVAYGSFCQVPALNDIVKSNTLSPNRVGSALEAAEPYTASGTDTYTVSISVTGLYSGSATYASGDQFTIMFTNPNATTTPTINVNGEGAKTIVDNKGNAVAAGDISGILKLYYDGTNFRVVGGTGGSGISRDFHREWSETIDFTHNEIFFDPYELTADVNYQIGSGNLVDQSSTARQRIITDGSYSLNFGVGIDFIYGIQNGERPPPGTYEIYFLYANGSVTVNFPGVSSETSSAIQLPVPNNFAAVADGETAIDLSWDDVTGDEGYLVQFSLTGTGGWSTLETTAQNATTSTQTGLSAGNTRYYRITTLGNGTTTLDSEQSGVISGQTESSGDVTAPTFTFTPANGNTVWTVNRATTIIANEPLRNTDGSEITNANVASRITLKETNSGGANIAFTAIIDGTKQHIIITPTTHYGENQLVYVAINNVEDVNGNEVTVAQSITFTTTEYTFFNGTTSRLQFGDVLDALWTANDTNFWLELTVNNVSGSGFRPLVTKYDIGGNQRAFQWYINGSDVVFGYVDRGDGVGVRAIQWTGVYPGGDNVMVLKYDGAIDTNNGIDRVTLLIDGVVQGSKSLINSDGNPISGIIIPNVTSQLAVGAFINSAGTPVGTSFLTEEAKDFIVRSSNGTVVEINVPNLKLGTDTSGNSINGTWVP